MNLIRVRRLLAQGRAVLRFADHALIEGRKDGLTSDDLEEAVFHGEVIEDYGARGLLLYFTRSDGIPYHIVLEYVSGVTEISVVTAYVPDARLWQPGWKKRKQRKRK